MVLAIILVIMLNLAGFFYAWLRQSDHLTDAIYSISFIAIVGAMWNPEWNGLQIACAILVVVWALRLGMYLYMRINHMGKDQRFDSIRPNLGSLMGFWLLQTMSILLIALPVMFALSASVPSVNGMTFAGFLISAAGIVIESIADRQKFIFKADPENAGKFMASGIWSRIRHPNYSGEILMWAGVFLLSVTALSGWQWIAIASPVWVFVLLRYISGVPLLEQKAAKKYGSQVSYQEYLARSGRFLPGF